MSSSNVFRKMDVDSIQDDKVNNRVIFHGPNDDGFEGYCVIGSYEQGVQDVKIGDAIYYRPSGGSDYGEFAGKR